MSTAEISKPIPQTPRQPRAGFVGLYYLLTLFAGVFVLFARGRIAIAGDLVATGFYIAMTVVFYDFSRPGNRRKER